MEPHAEILDDNTRYLRWTRWCWRRLSVDSPICLATISSPLLHTHLLLTTQHFGEKAVWMTQLPELYTRYSDYVALNGKIRSEL